ncbi:MAG: ABC transporter ATP-binding protein [Planctomycetes bacterium]|nr:ABC transporter ATP-binding protein [Planctomycetota bacterium]
MRVELRQLGKRFGRVVALQDVSLELPAGSRTALIGPNGSGKSTLVRALLGMLAATGELLFDGEPAGEDRRALARRIAYVPQIAPRLAAPVGDVVRAVAGLRGRGWQQIAEVAMQLDVDLAALGKRPFRALSGGQRQKVLASLALAAGAELLLLDEPTASMDPKSRAAFFRLVEALPTGTTVLLCSHRLDEIRRLVDRVVVLAEGRVAWQGLAGAYLDDHAEAIVEVDAEGEPAAAWLRARGFTQGATGWWSRSLPVHERARLLGEIGRNLNGQLRDVMARDVERLQPPSPGAKP